MNRITNNDFEGFYVVTSASFGQNQVTSEDANLNGILDAGEDLDGNGVINSITQVVATTAPSIFGTPDLILDINRNEISGNNSSNAGSAFVGGGLGLRIGATGSLTGTGFATTLADTTGDVFGDGSGFGSILGVGANNALIGNGRTNARVTNNSLQGNLGEDIFIQSFISTLAPTTSAGAWTAAAFAPTTYQTDPLARLNLVLRGNTGDSIGVLEVGAFYSNAEAVFKSRDSMAAPGGPFLPGGARERNAQRLPARGVGTAQLPPFISPDLLVGNGFQYPGMGQSTFRVESDHEISGFLTGEDFFVDFLPVPPIFNANGISRITPFLDMPYGWVEVPPGTFQFDDAFLDIEPQPPTIPGG